MTLTYDAEFLALVGEAALKAQKDSVLPVHDVLGRRERMAAFVAGARPGMPADVEQTIYHVESAYSYKVAVYHLRKKSAPTGSGSTAAILHIHGGWYIGVSAEDATPSVATYVSHSGIPIFSVDYRLAPENPYPTPLEDCWASLLWLQSQAERFNIDPGRIAIMGESAGGGLAAALALVARDRGLSPRLAKQILIYPMLDDRTRSDCTNGIAIFGVEDVITGWTAYLGPRYNTNDVPAYAAASRTTDVKGLPPLYMDVGQLDVFVEEDLAYVQKFLAAGISMEFHMYTGVPHAFHRFAPTASVTKRAFANRLGAMLNIGNQEDHT
ncbi:hypothetical protein LTR66_004036 [Elasticomyces elasticus]|nr:hypothetical protein LTR66_004036 [Elasticomyces elasticus]